MVNMPMTNPEKIRRAMRVELRVSVVALALFGLWMWASMTDRLKEGGWIDRSGFFLLLIAGQMAWKWNEHRRALRLLEREQPSGERETTLLVYYNMRAKVLREQVKSAVTVVVCIAGLTMALLDGDDRHVTLMEAGLLVLCIVVIGFFATHVGWQWFKYGKKLRVMQQEQMNAERRDEKAFVHSAMRLMMWTTQAGAATLIMCAVYFTMMFVTSGNRMSTAGLLVLLLIAAGAAMQAQQSLRVRKRLKELEAENEIVEG